MRFTAFEQDNEVGIAVKDSAGELRGLTESNPEYPGSLDILISESVVNLSEAWAGLLNAPRIYEEKIVYLPPIQNPSKIICIGLNYVDHSTESGFEPPDYPTVFSRFASTLIGHKEDIFRPRQSEQLDFEGEIAAVIGRTCYKAKPENALDFVAGYSLFNDVSVRDYQFKSPQWTMGKNFDGTGVFGPEFITPEELPAGVKGIKIETLLNNTVVQSATTDDMIFDIATLIVELSDVMTLVPGDIIVTGTPAGVGMARDPQLWMKPGDIIEVRVEHFGTLSNKVVMQPKSRYGEQSTNAH